MNTHARILAEAGQVHCLVPCYSKWKRDRADGRRRRRIRCPGKPISERPRSRRDACARRAKLARVAQLGERGNCEGRGTRALPWSYKLPSSKGVLSIPKNGVRPVSPFHLQSGFSSTFPQVGVWSFVRSHVLPQCLRAKIASTLPEISYI